jgi:hypothetical protein
VNYKLSGLKFAAFVVAQFIVLLHSVGATLS